MSYNKGDLVHFKNEDTDFNTGTIFDVVDTGTLKIYLITDNDMDTFSVIEDDIIEKVYDNAPRVNSSNQLIPGLPNDMVIEHTVSLMMKWIQKNEGTCVEYIKEHWYE